jgi:aldose 1-epimerase
MNTPNKGSRISLVTLTAGDLVVDLAPEIGGSVASFRTCQFGKIVDLMRPMSEKARVNRNPGGAAMFPMVPFANRIAGNRFNFEGHTYHFERNVPGERFTIHGTGWQSAWALTAADTVSAELKLDHLKPDEPYSYSAFQRFRLFPDRLMVITGVVNRGDRAMPFGFGQHPFFDREANVTLRFRSTHFWLGGAESVATERIATPPELDFSPARPLPRTWRDNCYAGWDGCAEITFPRSGIGLRIEAGPLFRHLMLYCDPDKPFFCVEPQTHAAGALNRIVNNGEDCVCMVVLKPGESVEAEMSFVQFLI